MYRIKLFVKSFFVVDFIIGWIYIGFYDYYVYLFDIEVYYRLYMYWCMFFCMCFIYFFLFIIEKRLFKLFNKILFGIREIYF